MFQQRLLQRFSASRDIKKWFQQKGNLFQFLCLCSGLPPAPRILAKLVNIFVSILRRINIRLIIFLDNILITGKSIEKILMNQDTVAFLLQFIGLVITLQKSNQNQAKKWNFQMWKSILWNGYVPAKGKITIINTYTSKIIQVIGRSHQLQCVTLNPVVHVIKAGPFAAQHLLSCNKNGHICFPMHYLHFQQSGKSKKSELL